MSCWIVANVCMGWVGLTNKPAQSNSSIVQLLESMGAVLYVKTNVPQSLMVHSLSLSLFPIICVLDKNPLAKPPD